MDLIHRSCDEQSAKDYDFVIYIIYIPIVEIYNDYRGTWIGDY
jgi:hypothetical protein